MFAPIALFVYNRPRHLRQTVEALARNELAASSDLFVFSDAPRGPEGEQAVREVREYLRTVSGFRSIRVVEREQNLGLAGSIIAGVSELVERFGRVVVVEDDLLTSPHFLSYMNDALRLYQDDERVISIHGYVYPVAGRLPETFFLKGADCWGWGTWKRGWDLFEPDGAKLLARLKARRLERRFDVGGSYPYTRMLQDQIEGKNDSWAIRWYASALLNDRLTLYPGRSLVQNIGVDNSGTNCCESGSFLVELVHEPVALGSAAVAEDGNALRLFERYFSSLRVPLYRRLLGRLGMGGR